MIFVAAKPLEAYATALLDAGGFTGDEAKATAKSLILSNLMGHDSHGIVRIRQYIEQRKAGMIVSGAALSILNETPNALHADAGLGLGQVQMPRLLDALFEKAKTQAVVSGAIVNSAHVGRLGEWVEMAAQRGFAAFMAVNDNGTFQMVAPHGGIEARTSTNPMAFSIPLKDGDDFTIDLSTSATAMGKVRLAHMAGVPVPEGQLQDAHGNLTTDTDVLFSDPKGTILPFGGHKGFALSMMVDLLVSGLSGGLTPPAPEGTPETNNVLITLWNPAFFAGLSHMQDEAARYIAHIRSAKPKDVQNPVRIPGERAKAVYQERLKNGIPLDDTFCQKLEKYAHQLGVTSSPFPAR